MGKKDIADRIGMVEYKNTALSDHMVLDFRLNQRVERKGGGVWCLNSSLVKDERYKKKMRECINRRMDENMYEEDIGRWWESFKTD